MDFEEQLEKAEKLTTPSLVGASMRSADDSAHQNYIHPEKSHTKPRPAKHSILNLAIGASLDDLINEGALLGSEEDFERFLDEGGNVRNKARYLGENTPLREELAAAKADIENSAGIDDVIGHASDADAAIEPVADDKFADYTLEKAANTTSVEGNNSASGAGGKAPDAVDDVTEKVAGLYSAPNLSEYQLDHQISSHDQLVDLVLLYDVTRLPTSSDRERGKEAASYPAPAAAHAARTPIRRSGADARSDDARVAPESLHTPYFPRDRSPSRLRSANPPQVPRTARSRLRSSKPHLARGDSYKSTHGDAPAGYELPAELAPVADAEDDDSADRRTRQSKPTMGELIAAAEAGDTPWRSTSVTRDASLVTTGDYTNFNCDAPAARVDDAGLFSVRLAASTRYLREISRLRLRPAVGRGAVEKNDADPHELAAEGALVNDDAYGGMGLDEAVERVLGEGETSEYVPSVAGGRREGGASVASVSEAGEEADEEAGNDTEAGNEPEPEVENDKAVPEVTDKVSEQVEPEVEAEPEAEPEEVQPEAEAQPEVEAEPETKVTEHETTQTQEDPGTARAELETEIELELKPVPDVDGEPVSKVSEEVEAHESAEAADQEVSEVHEKVTVLEKTESEVRETAEPADDPVESTTEESKPEVDEAKTDAEAEAEVDEPEPVSETAEREVDQEEPVLDKVEPVNDIEEPAAEESEQPDVEDKDVPEVNTSANLNEKEVPEVTEVTETAQPDLQDKTHASTSLNADPAPEDESFEVSPEELRKHLQSMPIYLFTSLAGGMQIIQKTNRLATILQGNGIKFEYRDLGTDEAAKKLWRRYAQGKTLPGVVRGDDFIGDWKYIDEVNEDYRLHEILYETL